MKYWQKLKNEKKFYLFFILIILIATFLRIWNIKNRGLYYHDETAFVANARFYALIIKEAISQVLSFDINLSELTKKAYDVWQDGGTPWQRAKPLLHNSYILITVVFGDKEFVCQLFSGLVGILTLFHLLKIKIYKNKESAFIAIIIITFSIWHLHYSRSALSQSLSLFMLCWTIKEILNYHNYQKINNNTDIDKESKRKLTTICLLTGLSFTTHYNLFWFPVIVGGWLCYLEWENFSKFWQWLKKMIYCAFIMIVPLLFFEIPSKLVMPLARKKIDDPVYAKAFSSYFEQIHFQVNWFDGRSFDALSPFFIIELFSRIENFLLVGFLILSFVYLVFKSINKDKNAIFLLLILLIPYYIYLKIGYPGPRSFLPILLIVAITSSLIIDFLIDKFKLSNKYIYYFSFSLITILSFLQYEKINQIIKAESPYKKVSEEIINLNKKNSDYYVSDKNFTVFNKPIYRYYLKKVVRRGKSEGGLIIDDFSSKSKDRFIDLKQDNLLFSVNDNLSNEMIMEDSFLPDKTNKYYNNLVDHKIDIYYSGK